MSRSPGWIAFVISMFVLSSCGGALGPSAPECDELNGAITIEAQSVPGTEYVPCLNDLQPGWEYENLEAENGRSKFYLDSDRMGDNFIEVILEATCDPADAEEFPSDEEDTRLYIDLKTREVEVGIVLIPEGDDPASHTYAASVWEELRNERVRGRQLEPEIISGTPSTTARISDALERGNPVLVVGPRELEEDTVELHLPNNPTTWGSISLRQALDLIESTVGEQVYRATWYYVFEGGCVTYSIDATGEGVESVIEDLQETLGLAPLADARRQAEEQGLVVP